LIAIATAIRFILLHHEARNKVTVLLVLGSVIWLLMSALETTSDDLPTKLVFFKLQFIGVVIIPTMLLILTMQVRGYDRRINRSNLMLLSVVPAATLLLIFANESHGLIWNSFALNSVNPFLPLSESRSLGYWLLIVGYSYGVGTCALGLFARSVIASRSLFRRQAFPSLFASCVPWMLSAIWLLNPSIFMYIDPAPLGFTLTYTLLLWKLTHSARADIVPIAHDLIFDSMMDAVIILDAQNRIIEMNPTARQIVGHSLRDALGRTAEKVWSEWPTLKKELDSGAEGVREISFRVGPTTKVYEVQSSYLSGIVSKVPNTLIVLRDVTERKRMEEELRESERMAAIGETAAMVGHDLRNPLQGISTATYLLRKILPPTNESEAEELLETIEACVHHSDRIVSDLLEYSRTPKLNLEEADLSQLVNEAVTSVKIPRLIGVRLIVGDLRVRLDRGMMRRVFVNIITNAVDAMPHGGELLIETREDDVSLDLSFKDTGTGFSDEALAKIWKPLNTTKSKGSGLGLAICRRIVEAHNGTIAVKTARGSGATITITLPTKAKESEGYSENMPPRVDAQRVPQVV